VNDEVDLKKHETGWLEVLFVYFHRELAHGHFFRTAVDNWSMYRRGNVFLSRGKPRFFNKPKSDDRRLPLMDFVSNGAKILMRSVAATTDQLIVDHAIPISQLHKIIRESKPRCVGDVEAILLRSYRLGVITYEEDRKLRDAGLQSKMPSDWSAETGSPYARYHAVGITRCVDEIS
jgi:hypothetical protein